MRKTIQCIIMQCCAAFLSFLGPCDAMLSLEEEMRRIQKALQYIPYSSGLGRRAYLERRLRELPTFIKVRESFRKKEVVRSKPLKILLEELPHGKKIPAGWRVKPCRPLGEGVWKIIWRHIFKPEEPINATVEDKIRSLKTPTLWNKVATFERVQDKHENFFLKRILKDEGALDSQDQPFGNILFGFIPGKIASLLYQSRLFFPDVLLFKDYIVIVPVILRRKEDKATLKVFCVEDDNRIDINDASFQEKSLSLLPVLEKCGYNPASYQDLFVVYRFTEEGDIASKYSIPPQVGKTPLENSLQKLKLPTPSPEPSPIEEAFASIIESAHILKNLSEVFISKKTSS